VILKENYYEEYYNNSVKPECEEFLNF